MTDLTPPNLAESRADDLVLVENALVVPLDADKHNTRLQVSGVLTPEGEIVPNSITWANGRMVNSPPEMPDPETVEDLDGTFVFAGILFGHFGHFLVESTTRLWALDHIKEKVDGVLYCPKVHRNHDHIVNVYTQMFKALGVDMPVLNLRGPVRAERLYVPRQGFGLGDMIEGSANYRNFMQNAGKNIAPKGAEKIYISRSQLPPFRGGLLVETLMEDYLREEGYEIFHPQQHSQEDQIAQYKAARQIISVDSSPLHLVGFVGRPDVRVAILQRRDTDTIDHFITQLDRFRGISAFRVNALTANWLPLPTNRPGRSSFGEVSYAKLYDGLKENGMITGTTRWRDITDEERQAALEAVRARHETDFVLWQG